MAVVMGMRPVYYPSSMREPCHTRYVMPRSSSLLIQWGLAAVWCYWPAGPTAAAGLA